MAANIWKIQNLTEAWQAPVTFASLNLQGLKIRYPSADSHTASFTKKVSRMDSAFQFNWQDRVAIFRNGVPWFVGNVTQPSASGTASDQSFTYEISNDWWRLAKRQIFQQQWFIGMAYYPRVILGQAVADFTSGIWEKQTADLVIREVLGYSIAILGAPFQVGTITPGPEIPYTERVSITCAEAIVTMIKWIGSCNVHWDYTTRDGDGNLKPTIHILKRSECAAKHLPITDARLVGLPKIMPLNNAKVPVVGVWYEEKNTNDDDTATNYTLDKHPSDQTLEQDGALLHIIELSGSSSTWEKNNVITSPLPVSPDDGGSSATLKQWLVKHDSDFAKINPANLQYWPGSFDSKLFPDLQTDVNGNTLSGTFDSTNLPNELVKGNIVAWQARPAVDGGGGTTTPGDGYEHVAKLHLQFDLSYNFSASGITREEFKAAWNLFRSNNYLTVGGVVTATDMSTQLYKQLTNGTEGEAPPAGIAEYLFNALNQLHYEGEIRLMEQDCSGYFKLNNTANITGSENAGWATMNAQIKEIVEEVEKGTTSILFGPPTHLGPQDIIDLLRATRTATPSARLNERATGKNSRTPEIDRTSEGIAAGTSKTGILDLSLPWAPIDNDKNEPGTIILNQKSHVYNLDGTDLPLDNIENTFTPVVGQAIYINVPLKADCSVNTDGDSAPAIFQKVKAEIPLVTTDVSDPANVFVDQINKPLIEFADISDPRDPDLLVMLEDNTTVVKCIHLCKTDLHLVGRNTVDQSIFGVDYTVATQNMA